MLSILSLTVPRAEPDRPSAGTPTRSALHERRARRNASREAPRPDGRQKLLTATERLIAETSLAEISVGRIAGEAEVSRGTFYVHFESKFEVVAALLTEIMDEMYDLLAPITDAAPDQSRDAAIREVLTESSSLWQRHRAVFRAIHENYTFVPEFRDKWLGFTEQFTDALVIALADEIFDGGRRDVRQVCASLVWTTEHLLYVAGTSIDDDLPSPAAITETLVQLWVGTLFGRLPEPP
jgi:AcrR family transcriptional regulator